MATFRQLYTYTISLDGQRIATKSSEGAALKVQSQHPGSTIAKKKGKVQAMVRKAGYKPQSQTFPNKSQAEVWASIQEGNMNSGQFKDPLVVMRMKVRELMQRYEAEFTAGKQSAKNEKRGLKNVYRLLGDRLLPVSGQREGELSRKDIRWYVKTRREEGVQSDTIRKELNPLSHCLNIASDAWEDIPELDNVVYKAKHIMKATKELLPGNRRTRRIWQDEIDALLGDSPQTYYAPRAFLWAVNTGMRRSEICQALLFETWFDVHDATGKQVYTTRAYLKASEYIEDRPDAGLKMVPRPNPRKKYFNPELRLLYLPAEITKTDRERYVYLTDEALEVMSQMPSSTDGRLFPVRPGGLTNWVVRRTKVTGIKDLRWHDARHEALSRLAEMQWGIERISASSGHEDWETLKRYLHPSNLVVKRDSVTGRIIAPDTSREHAHPEPSRKSRSAS